MGGALAKGLLINNSINPASITVSNPHIEKIAFLSEKGVNITDSNIEALKDAHLLVVAVKPWKVEEVVKELLPHIDENVEISLIVAGVPGTDLMDMFGERSPRNICISMPNTAMGCGKSMTFLVKLKGDCKKSEELFSQVGAVKVIEERLLPAATALASCGIAYAMRYVRAATEGGVELGFRASEAQDIVAQTLAGAVTLLLKEGAHPEAEIDKVTTPGGITIRGLNAMEKAGFSSAVIQGLIASRP